MLRNAGGGRVSDFPEKSVTKMYGSTLLPLRKGWVGDKFPEKKRYVTLEWPPIYLYSLHKSQGCYYNSQVFICMEVGTRSTHSCPPTRSRMSVKVCPPNAWHS